jgi:hypothetical protein
MRALMSTICGLAAGGLLAMSAQTAMAENNILDGNSNTILTGETGHLRSGTQWDGTLPVADKSTLTDGILLPENQIWNQGSVWWDQENGGVSIEFDLNHEYSLDKFLIQADDNDNYLLQYWNGSTWKTAFDAGIIDGGFGLTTRESASLPAIYTDKLLLTVVSGDGLYSVSEVQAFGAAVPEPATWAMMLIGVAAIGAGLRTQRRTTLATA